MYIKIFLNGAMIVEEKVDDDQHSVLYVPIESENVPNFWDEFFGGLSKFSNIDYLSVLNDVIGCFLQQKYIGFLEATMRVYLLEKNNLCPFYQLFKKFKVPTNKLDERTAISLFNLLENGYDNIVKYLILVNVNSNTVDIRDNAPFKNCSLLYFALYANMLDMAKWLIEDSACNIRQKNDDGDTPIIMAIRKNHYSIVQLLIENGEDLKPRDNKCIPLFTAVEQGNADLVSLLIENNADVNVKTSDGSTPLFVAVSKGYFQIVQLLIENEADVNVKTSDGSTPLFVAVSKGYFQIVQLLIENEADVNAVNNYGATPLFDVFIDEELSILLHLLEKGAKVDILDSQNRSPFYAFLSKGGCISVKEDCSYDMSTEYFLYLYEYLLNKNVLAIADNSGCTLLHLVCKNRNMELVSMLLNYVENLDVNIADFESNTALHLASQNGDLGIVKALLDHKVNLLDHKAKPNLKNNDGNVPLNLAILNNHLEVAEYLIQQGVTINSKNLEEKTVLHLAVLTQNFNFFELLINRMHGKNGCFIDINAQDKGGMTALHCAISACQNNRTVNYNMIGIIEYLVNLGAKTDIKDKNGVTPANLALSKNLQSDELKRILGLDTEENHEIQIAGITFRMK